MKSPDGNVVDESAPAIRRFRPDDAPALAALTLAAIRRTAARAYSPEQVAAWGARHPDPRRFRDCSAKGDVILVATDGDDAPLAYVLMEASGHVDMLYCDPGHGGRGLAGHLLALAQAEAQRLGCDRLFTEASELARPVFARAGYEEVRRRDFELRHKGAAVPIHNYAMEKRLRKW